MRTIVAQSEDTICENAAIEIIAQVKSSFGNTAPTAGILYCSVEYDHKSLIDMICKAFPGIELIGCTTDGEISSRLGFTEDSVCLLAIHSDSIEIKVGVGNNISSDGSNAGERAALSALSSLKNKTGKHKFAIILSDPISAGTSGVDIGVKKVFGENFPVIGGVAAAHSKKRLTYQFHKDAIYTDSVVIMLFAGPVTFSCGIKGGHSALGQKMNVSQHDKNILYKIGNTSAYDYFYKYIGDHDLFMNYCLAVFEQDSDDYYVLSAPASDQIKGTVRLNGNLPDNAMVQIGTADKNVIMSSCRESINNALNYFKGDPEIALFFSCAGRKMIMGTKIFEECGIAKQLLPQTPFIGFYCYGEFAPLKKDQAYRFHGTTFVCILIGEEFGA